MPVSSHGLRSQIIIEEDTVIPVTLGDDEIMEMVLDTFARHLAVICPNNIYILEVNVKSDHGE